MKLEYPLLIDGGLSNVLEADGCNLNHKLWSADLLDKNPEAIINAHYKYIIAGAKCITTSSYQASKAGFTEAGYSLDKAQKLILKSVELTEIAINRAIDAGHITTRPLIAASIGPYGAYLADGSEYRGDYDVTDEVLKDFHAQRIKLLETTCADLFACETIPSLQEAKVLSEILANSKKHAWVSFSCKDEDHINDGSTIEEAVALFASNPNVFAIGVNCTAPKFISGIIKSIRRFSTDKKIVVYPNSGEVYNAKTKTWIGISEPSSFTEMVKEWNDLGADIIGGCCRIGLEHIKGIHDLLANFRKLK